MIEASSDRPAQTDARNTLSNSLVLIALCAKPNGMCKRFRELVAEAQRAIELLQERRTALISAAVTGKIDVRAMAPRS